MLHVLNNGICTTCTPERGFDPSEPRDPHTGKWGAAGEVIAKAEATFGKHKVQIHAHEGGGVSIHDQHGGSLHLANDAAIRKFRRDVNTAGGLDMGEAHTPNKLIEKDGQLLSLHTHGIRKNHIATAAEVGQDEDPYYHDKVSLHLAAGGVPSEETDDLLSRPGTHMTTGQLENFADAVAHVSGAKRLDTGHGQVDVHHIGSDYTIAPVGKGAPIVLDRRSAKAVNKALEDARESYGDSGGSLGDEEQFSRTISTNAGDIHVTRQGINGPWWIETDTDAIQFAPDKVDTFLEKFGEPFQGAAETYGLKNKTH